MRLLLALLLGAPLSLAAQPLTTDRPDFTESPTAVAPGRIQIEAGTTLSVLGRREDSPFAEQTELVLPEALVRIGVMPGLEARITAPDYTRIDFTTMDTSLDGFSDPSVGLKAEIGTFGGTSVGVIAEASLPVVNGTLSDTRVVPSVIVTAGGDLTETLSLGAQVYTEIYGDNNGPFRGSTTLGGTLVLGVSLNEQAGFFAEFVVEDVIGGAGTTVDPYALVHTGATLLLSPNAQLDAHAGVGVSGYAPDYLVGVGASVRI